MTVNELLTREATRHPLSEAADIYKILYQRYCGPGHMVDDPDAALSFLRREADCPRKLLPLTEALGNGLVRLNLDSHAFRPELAEAAARCFTATANSFPPDIPAFRRALAEAAALTREGRFPWEGEALEAFIREKEAEGWPAVHHSPVYRTIYTPRYRVTAEAPAKALPAVRALLRAEAAPRGVLAIDGRCGCGKTTLAAALSALFGWPVVHMDDFFLPPALRTAKRLATPGQNVHYERVEAEVLLPFSRGEPVSFRPFDCSTGDYEDAVTLPPSEHLLLEGSYAHHPVLRKYEAAFVFVTASPDTQYARLAARNPDSISAFQEKWIPLEERYFAVYPSPEGCEYVRTDKEEP